MTRYPSLELLAAGGQPATSQDRSGRVSTRADQAPTKPKQSRQGGTPAPNPGFMVPYLQRAASQTGKKITPDVLKRVAEFGGVPQLMAQKYGTSDPDELAKLLLGGKVNGVA